MSKLRKTLIILGLFLFVASIFVFNVVVKKLEKSSDLTQSGTRIQKATTSGAVKSKKNEQVENEGAEREPYVGSAPLLN